MAYLDAPAAVLTLLCASALPWSASAEERFEPTRWLRKPGTRFLLAVVHARRSPNNAQMAPKFQALRNRYDAQGLKLVHVSVVDGRACESPTFRADDFICNDGAVLPRLGITTETPVAFLWSWDGRLLAQKQGPDGLATAIDRALARAPQVTLDARGEGLAGPFARAVKNYGRMTLAKGTIADSVLRAARAQRFSGYYLNIGACRGQRKARGDLVLGARAKGARVDLVLRTLSGCRLARVRARFDHLDPEASLLRGLLALGQKLADPPVFPKIAPPPPPIKLAVSHQAMPADHDGTPQTTAQRSLETLRMVRAQGNASLLGAVEPWIGVRHSERGDGMSGISGANFARRIMRTAYGIDIGQTIYEQLEKNPEVVIDERNATANLVPGDLLFFVTYAYRARHVMIYLGSGKVAHAARVRGVVVEDAPKQPANYLYLVARRPRL